MVARRIVLRKPITFIVDDRKIRTSTIVEFVATAKAPIPARAIDPMLAVGDHLIREYRYEAPNRLVFIEPEPEVLAPGTEVRFQWGTHPAEYDIGPVELVYEPKEISEEKR